MHYRLKLANRADSSAANQGSGLVDRFLLLEGRSAVGDTVATGLEANLAARNRCDSLEDSDQIQIAASNHSTCDIGES